MRKKMRTANGKKNAGTGRKALFCLLTGLLTGFCYAAGKPLDRYDSLDLTDKGFYGSWLLLTALSAVVLFFVWSLFERAEKLSGERAQKRSVPVWGCALFLFLCWLPAFLSIYPGAFAYDALAEWQQLHTGQITSHHPVIHVVLLGGLVELGHTLTGDYNVGIAMYTLLQMAAFAFLLALSVRFMRECGIPWGLRLFAVLFYGFSPVMQLSAISATKDILFTGTELLFFLYVILFYCRRKAFFESRKRLAGFCACAFFTMILRNNGLYIVLVMLVIMAFSCIREWKRLSVRLLVVLAGILVPYLCYVGPFYHMLRVTPGGVEEMLSVPLQQMARVYRYDYESLDGQELELLYRFVPQENLKDYRATVSDFVKKGFNREYYMNNKASFFKLWLKLGTEHPLTYINSFLINTVDAWYPHAIIDGYRHADGRSSYFDYKVDQPGEERVLLPGLHDFYETLSLDAEAQKAPLAFLVLSPGWYFVLFLGVFFYLWYRRRYRLFVPCLLPVLHFATVLLGPMALVRYMLLFYAAFPVLLSLALFGNRYEESAQSGEEVEE